MREEESIKVGGIPANTIVIPLAVIIAILHIVVIGLVFKSNYANRMLSDLLQDCSDYQQYATNLQAGSSTLSETASSFAQIPVGTDGQFNAGPLLQYAQELGRNRRGPQVAEWFRTHDADAEVQSYIDTAAIESEQMYETQIHVIALLCSIYPQPPIPELSAIPADPLTEEELAMTTEQREAYARSLIFQREYSQRKASVAENIENCHRVVQQKYAVASSQCQRLIDTLRIWLWIVMIVIILLMMGTFVFFFRWLVIPLRNYSRQITTDRELHQESSIREMRVLVDVYNALLKRHNKLEAILRSAAETDALTELPNRYSLQQDVLQTVEEDGSMAVLLFDVNYLKRANDMKGHMAGDKLLRLTAACIRECFATDHNGRCYRIGGDEFAAVLRNCSEEEVRRRIEHFSLATEREHISVSVGYSFAERTDENSFEKLSGEADQMMYADKKRIHELDRTPVRN